jgi:uncharacterized protein (TIGR00730 family)
MRTVCVFCGSSAGRVGAYIDAAAAFGRELAARGLGLVFGAGHVGLMGVLADAVLAAGGSAVGVIPSFMVEKELAHRGLTELLVVETMHQRKALMAERSDAFVALPGGFGTLEELFEIVTWGQLGIHRKPVGVLNVGGFFDPLLAWVRRAGAEGFIKQKHLDLLRVALTPAEMLDVLSRHV